MYIYEKRLFLYAGGGPNYAIQRNYILSATRSDASREMGSILWINTELATLQYLLSVAIWGAIRGARSSRGNPMKELHPMDLYKNRHIF